MKKLIYILNIAIILSLLFTIVVFSNSSHANYPTNDAILSHDSSSSLFFSPNGDGTNDTLIIPFSLGDPSQLKIEIYKNDDLIKEVVDDFLESGNHEIIWDGTDANENLVEEGEYRYSIVATPEIGSGVSTLVRFVVKYDPCAEFYDISIDDSICPALEYVKKEGIFQGYINGDFKPDKTINRVEAPKTVLEAFDVFILESDGTDLGFPDVYVNEWYMKYLRTGKEAGIIQGHEDGYYRPDHKVNRVEILKILLKTSDVDLSNIVVSEDPYPDTSKDEWFATYVQFSKNHNLIDTDEFGNFNPAQNMLRGDVAELFYRFHQEGFM